MTLRASDVALVTGASSGIGRATVVALAARDLTVHAVARRSDRLLDLADETGCAAHVLDVRDRDVLYELGSSLEVDVLVANAGVGSFTPFADVAVDEIDAALDTNVQAAVHTVRAFLPTMIAKGRGHVVAVGSMAGTYAIHASVYGASKAAVHMLATNLRLELEGSGVRVTEIAPGRVESELYPRAVPDEAKREEHLNTGTINLAPVDVAGSIMHALDAPAHVNINRIELQPTEQTYGGMRFVVSRRQE